MIVGLLLAALVGPFLIDWNSFRPNFERYASGVLGQPVRIVGDAQLRLLPAPTLTLEMVEVGETEGRPMATVGRFSVRVELLPLLGGQVRVTELTLDGPQVNVTVDDAGRLDWLIRQGSNGPLDPDDISFDQIRIVGGSLHFFDARTGGEISFTEINTDLFEGSSLAGPWRIRGSMACFADVICPDGMSASFNLASGRVADDGSLRLTADVTPLNSEFSGTIRAEGTVRPESGAVIYAGTFDLHRPSLPQGDEADAWLLSGAFRLEPQNLVLNAFSWESADGRLVFTGDATLGVGDDAHFEIIATSRQVDLDQRLGDGAVVAVADVAAELWQQLGAVAPPSITGRIAITIPSVIASGSLLQDFVLEAVASADHWRVDQLGLRLPGGTTLGISGRFWPGDTPNFVGDIVLAAEQPSVFATWWYGHDMSQHMLPPTTLELAAEFAEHRVAFQDIQLTIGSQLLNGAINWAAAADETGFDTVTAALATNSFDFDQLRALGTIVLGPEFGLTNGTTRYSVRFAANELLAGEVAVESVEVGIVVTPVGVEINDFVIGNLDGARISVNGELTNRPGDTPGGRLTITVAAEHLDGVVALARQLMPETELTGWLERRAPYLAPLNLQIIADGPEAADLAYAFAITGTAVETTIRAEIGLERGVADWAVGEADIVVDIDAVNATQLARQLGLFEPGETEAGAAAIDFTATGVPAGGLETHFQATLTGVVITSDGILQTDGLNPARFDGPIDITGNIEPLARLLGIATPTPGQEVPAVINTELQAEGRAFDAVIAASSSIAGRTVQGRLHLDEAGPGWNLTGNLGIDQVDLGWLTSWPLGIAALPTVDTEQPWSPEPFPGPLVDTPSIGLDLNIARLIVSDQLTVANADIGFAIDGNQVRIELRDGALSTGLIRSEIVLDIRDGQANLEGRLSLFDIPLEALVWQTGVQPAATGVVTSFHADFTAFGRSMAGLVANLTGTGTVEIDQGAFNYFAAEAFDQTVQLVDEGATLTGEALRETFTGFLDAGRLEFGEQQINFSVTAGVVAPDRIIVDGGGARANGGGTIDLNRMTLDSTWQLMAVGETDDGPQPQAQVSFAGPLGAPQRDVNVAALAAYLNVRRLQEAERLEAELLERERFLRLIARIEADRAAAEQEGQPTGPDDPAGSPAGAVLPGAGAVAPAL